MVHPVLIFFVLQRLASEESLKKLNRMSGPLSMKEAAVVFKIASQLNPQVGIGMNYRLSAAPSDRYPI